MSDYQVEVLMGAIAYAYGDGKIMESDREEAQDMVAYLKERGWRLTREDSTGEYVTEGPIQRALGISDGGDGF